MKNISVRGFTAADIPGGSAPLVALTFHADGIAQLAQFYMHLSPEDARSLGRELLGAAVEAESRPSTVEVES